MSISPLGADTVCKSRKQEQLFRRALHARLVTALQRRLRRKAVAKLCEWPSSRCVSDSGRRDRRYIRWRAQYAARRLVLVKVDLPKGTGGLTGHHHASPSHDRAAHTGGWRRPLLYAVWPPFYTGRKKRENPKSKTTRAPHTIKTLRSAFMAAGPFEAL